MVRTVRACHGEFLRLRNGRPMTLSQESVGTGLLTGSNTRTPHGILAGARIMSSSQASLLRYIRMLTGGDVTHLLLDRILRDLRATLFKSPGASRRKLITAVLLTLAVAGPCVSV